MAVTILLATVLLLLSVATLSARINVGAHNYVLLITDVNNYYGTSCVILVHSEYTDLNMTRLTHTWTLELSRRKILSVSINFGQLVAQTEMYNGRIHRPLFVVLLDTRETMDAFAKAASHIDMSHPVWLVIFMDHPGSPLEDFCREPTHNVFNLMFNAEMLVLCYDHPILKEWYAVGDGRTRVFDLATWTPETGLILSTTKSLYARRENMYGETLRVASVEESPFITIKDGYPTQFFGRILTELSNVMNFSIVLLSPVEAYGSWNEEEQKWTGVIGQIISGKADFGVSEFSMTNHRQEVVDFTLPLLLSRNRLYIKQPDGTAVKWSGYFKAFEFEIWAMIIFIIVTTPILLTVIKTRGCVVMKIIMDNYIHVWGIYCQQGLSEFPHESSLRLAFLSIFVSALIISSAYSASLISFLTVTTAGLPFSTMEGFIKDGSYKLIVFGNSADYDMIVNTEDKILLKLKALLKKKQDLPLTLMEGLEQVCSEKVGFYTTEAIKNAITFYLPCKLVFVETGRTDSLALALNKGNPYRGLINYHLQRFHDNGMMNRLRAKYVVIPNHPNNTYDAVGLWGIAPILAVLAGGAALAWIILVLERAYYCAPKSQCRAVRPVLERLSGTVVTRSPDAITRKNKKKHFKMREKHTLKGAKPALTYWP